MEKKSMSPTTRARRASWRHIVLRLAVVGTLGVLCPALLQAASTLEVPASGATDGWWRAGVVAHLGARLPVDGARIEVIDLSVPASAKELPAGTLVDIFEPSGWMRSSRVSLRAELRFADGSGRSTWVAVRMRLPITVPVAAVRLQRGERVGAERVSFDEVDLFSLRGRRPLSAVDLEQDISAVRTIAIGDVLTFDSIRSTPVVKRGQRIALIVRRGSLTLRTLGIARKTAATGEVIPISNADTGKVVVARVLDGETALVEGPGGAR